MFYCSGAMEMPTISWQCHSTSVSHFSGDRKETGIMAKWEYRTLDWGEIRKIGSKITGQDFIDENVDAGLNAVGQEEWELVTVYVDGYTMHRSNKGEEMLSSSRYVKYTFKRPVKEQTYSDRTIVPSVR
jgi:hypothetical protein